MISLLQPEIWVSLLTLTALEIVLGIDNLVFISIVSNSVPKSKQRFTRRVGLLGALAMRLLLLAFIFTLIGLTQPLFSVFEKSFSARDLILIVGGLFLIIKGTTEIHTLVEGEEEHTIKPKPKSVILAILQIMVFDIIFSLDSILTAVALTDFFLIMAIAIIIAILAMIWASEPLHKFIHAYPTIKMLALSFLLLIGMLLVADGFGVHIPRGYIYFAISFSVFIEILNQLARRKRKKN